MRNSFWLLGVAAVMATLVSCNRNAKPEPAVYELEVYKTQEIIVEEADGGGMVRRTLPSRLIEIDGKNVLVFISQDSTLSYYDLETGKKMSGVESDLDKEKGIETFVLDTTISLDVQLASSKEVIDTMFTEYNGKRVPVCYDMTNDVYYGIITYDSNYYGELIHTMPITDKNFNYLGEIYNKELPWFSNGNILVNIEQVNQTKIKVNYLKLTKTDRDYKQYIDSCRADLEKKHKDWEEYKIKNDAKKSPVIELVKSQNEISSYLYKVLTLYCDGNMTDGEKMVIDSLIANKEIVNPAPIYVVISAESDEQAASYVKENGLDCLTKVVFDTEGISKMEDNPTNPRFIYVEDDLITIDTMYDNENIGRKLFPRLFGEGEFTRYFYNELYGGLIVGVDYNIIYE